MHFYPACVCWTIRWHTQPESALGRRLAADPAAAAAWEQASVRDLVLLPMIPYAAWAAAYYLKARGGAGGPAVACSAQGTPWLRRPQHLAPSPTPAPPCRAARAAARRSLSSARARCSSAATTRCSSEGARAAVGAPAAGGAAATRARTLARPAGGS